MMMNAQQSIADLCRPLSAKVQPASRRHADPVGIAELVPAPRLRPIIDGPAIDISAPVRTDSPPPPPETNHAPPPVARKAAKSRHDPEVQTARDAIRALYDGKRTTRRIAELSGYPRRTVSDHLTALGLAQIKGKAGPSDSNNKRRAALIRRAGVKVMVEEGRSGPEIAAHYGVKASTIHADCIELKIKIPRGTGRKGQVPVEATKAAAEAKRAKSRDAKIAGAMAAFEAATGRAVAALKGVGLDADDIAERMRMAVRGLT